MNEWMIEQVDKWLKDYSLTLINDMFQIIVHVMPPWILFNKKDSSTMCSNFFKTLFARFKN